MLITMQIEINRLENTIHYLNEKGLTVVGSTRTDKGYILMIEKINLIWEKRRPS